MRIIAGRWRGRALLAPTGPATRPTADRVRQALFDMLWHAPWGGRAAIEGGVVLDAFAGTGALGLEALSRGAARAVFFERDRAALAVLRANLAACRADATATVVATDATRVHPGEPCSLVFLDPPYGRDLLAPALAALRAGGWLTPATLLVSEQASDEALEPLGALLAERVHGAARLAVWRNSL